MNIKVVYQALYLISFCPLPRFLTMPFCLLSHLKLPCVNKRIILDEMIILKFYVNLFEHQ